MSFSRGALVRTTQASRTVLRHESTSSTAGPSSAPLVTPTTTPPSPFPPLRASLLLSRPPLIQRTPHELETAYYIHSLRMRQALSNHIPESFYFRSGSLPHRRYKIAAHAFDVAAFGPEIAGPAPNVGEIPEERPIEAMPRDKWWKEDGERGNKSLERYPEDEVFCLVQDKSGEKKWGFPEVVVREGETLHGALETGLTSVDGALGGQTMDTWIVTRKPIGVVRDGQERNFFFKSHILAGEPKLKTESPWMSWTWLTKEEVETILKEQGDAELWDAVRRMFGVRSVQEQETSTGEEDDESE